MMEEDNSPGDGDIAGILFQNMRAEAATTIFGESNLLLGYANANVHDLIFDNVVVAGEQYDSIDDFVHNEYVHDLVFENTAPETMTYLNTSGYGKWYIKDDWDSGVEPANNDIVNHTAVADVLTVDAPVYAGTFNVSNVATATVSVEYSGTLTVTDTLSLGDASGGGELNLLDGILDIQNSSGGALSVVDGNIHIDKGTLLWAGDHISGIQSLFAAGKISMAGGQDTMLSASATLISQTGSSQLYADYNNATAGHTTVWVTESTPLSDFNGDGKVNLIDLSVMSADWQDGYDMTDLLQLAEDWLIVQ
jgi:hypothetical protein